MARKSKADVQKAKEAKQKKLLIGLLPLLLLLVVLQGPKLMHHSTGNVGLAPPPAAPTDPNVAAAPAPSVTAAPSVGGVTAPATAAAPAAASPSGLADTDVQPVAGSGQLVSFDLFATKDPFIQQVKSIPDGADPSAAAAGTSTSSAGPTGSDPFAGSPTQPGGATAGGSSAGGGVAVVPNAGPTEPMTAVAGITVNGRLEQVQATRDFPVAAPVFHLVSFNGSAAKIAVVDGAYQNGSPTLSLPKGKTITLMNTADGTRYALVYRGSTKVATSSLPPAPVAAPTTTTTPTPTTTPTTTTPAGTTTP